MKYDSLWGIEEEAGEEHLEDFQATKNLECVMRSTHVFVEGLAPVCRKRKGGKLGSFRNLSM